MTRDPSGHVRPCGRICSFQRFTALPEAERSVVPLLAVEGVTLRYGTGAQRVTATERVSFNVARSERYVILGPSGCGKSTLLKAVAGFVSPVEGRILLNGAVV